MKRGGFLQRRTPLKAKTGFTRKAPLKASRKPAKKKQTKADLWRQYGLERPGKPRYEGLKGIYWRLLSEKVRRRDFEKYGTCISCGVRFDTWQDSDPGHYIPAGTCGFDLLFDEKNIHGECKRCNGFDEGHLIGYERGLDMRYGAGTAKKLEDRYWKHKAGNLTKEWSTLEYDRNIRKLLAELG